ncbi:cupin domain-containing protein [Microbacterium sp.]|uniref:cupin domain-containing protein n=1 Tax=Microbacterium sp. TaxID=51671 RepID=UPI003C7857FA
MTGPDLVPRRAVDGTVIEWVARPALADVLDLEPHPEGGWYRRTWAGTQTVTVVDDTGGERRRPIATLIVFLLPAGEASAWHRVSSDEVWIWSGLGPVDLQLGGPGDEPVPGAVLRLGEASAEFAPQQLVPAGVWQRTLPAEHDALVSCLVAPGFDFEDFELEVDASPDGAE